MKAGIAAAAILIAAPTASFAEESWKTTARTELGYVELAMAADGWTLRRQFDPRSLADQQSGYMPLRLLDRYEYSIVALCDQHCGDVDLALYGPEDSLLSEDCAETGLPVVRVTPEERARYELEVRMFNCAEDACEYSVAVFARPTRVMLGAN